MKNKLVYEFKDHLRESLKDPEFKKTWRQTELEYELAKQLIQKRLAKNLSQRDLAKRVKTSQAVISRIESMKANPSLGLLKRITETLDSKIQILIK